MSPINSGLIGGSVPWPLVVQGKYVGIRTTSPTAALHIGEDGIRFPDGSLQTSAGVGGATNISATGDAIIQADSDLSGAGDILFQIGSSTKAVVTNAGNVGIGTTSIGAKVDIVPSSSSDVVFRSKSLQSTAPLGTELVSNGNFSTVPDTSWTWGSGWTHDTTNLEADHTLGSTAALTQNISVVNGQTYYVEITIKNRTAGYVTLDVNGVYIYRQGSENNLLESGNTYKRSFVANITGSAVLSITPTSDFDGSVDNISVKQVTGTSQPNFSLVDDTDNVIAEVRGKWSLNNVSCGGSALSYNVSGFNNTAIGIEALANNVTGIHNTAVGTSSLVHNTDGWFNTAVGTDSLRENTTGSFNSTVGGDSLLDNTTGSWNAAIGAYALMSNTTGSSNSGVGGAALQENTSGYQNSAIGNQALYSNTTGYNNSAVGVFGLGLNTTGSYNCAMGVNAGSYIADGTSPNQTSSNSVYLGCNTKASADGNTNEIVIGNNATGAGSDSVVLGNDSIIKTILKGNVGIATTSPGGSSTVGSAVLSIANGTEPVGGRDGQVSLFSKDVSASAELFVMDEAGNKTQLSPHPTDFLDTLPTEDRPFPWAYRSENEYLGKRISVDLAGLVAAVEKLTGKTFMFVEDIEARSWDDDQEAQRLAREKKREAAFDRIAELEQKIALTEDDEERAKLEEEKARVTIPEPYAKRPMPKWIADRLVTK